MNDQKLDEKLAHLKVKYEQMPIRTSPEQIMNRVENEKRPRRESFFQRRKAAIVTVCAATIASILFFPSLPFLQEREEMTTMELAEDRAIDEPSLNVFDATEEADVAQFETEEANITQFEMDNEEGMTETIVLEGMEETIYVKPFSDRNLPFYSVVDEKYEIETFDDGETYTLNIYAHFVDERIDPPFFTIEKYTDVQSIEEVREKIDATYTQYEEIHDESFFERVETKLTVVEERAFLKDESLIFVAIVEENSTYYTFTVEMYGLVGERTIEDARIILKHATMD